MEKKRKLQEENKKRNAFKRFSQIGITAGLTVSLVSSFSNFSSNQLPPAKIDKSSQQEQVSTHTNKLT